MKNILVLTLIFLSSLTQAQLTSKDEVAQELVAKREQQKKEITNSYLALKNSMVDSDMQAISSNAIKFHNALKNFKFKKLKLQDMNVAANSRIELLELATTIATSKNINEQRKIFESLSVKFWEQAAKFKSVDTNLHLQVCPMTGAQWISDSKEIRNPYYPKNMLTCGEVKASM